MNRVEKIVLPIITFLAIAAAWQVTASSGRYPGYLFPSPMDVVNGALGLACGYTLWSYLGTSLLRFLAGYFAAALVAIPLGLILGWYSRLWMAFNPLVQILRPISPIAWFPFISLWFGIGDLPAIVIIILAAFYPILLSTVAAVHNVDSTYLKVALNFGAGEWEILSGVVIPAAFPYIAMGLHVAVGSAWVFLVAGEMMGVRSGLGYLIVDSRNFLRTDLVLVGILFIGLMGLIIDHMIGEAERRVKRRWGGPG